MLPNWIKKNKECTIPANCVQGGGSGGNSAPIEYTMSELLTHKDSNTLKAGQQYDITDFHPTYKVKYNPLTFYTETSPRKLRFTALTTSMISTFGEMINEDFLFKFDFTTTTDYPQGRIEKIWNGDITSKILNHQKIYYDPINKFNSNTLVDIILGQQVTINGELVYINGENNVNIGLNNYNIACGENTKIGKTSRDIIIQPNDILNIPSDINIGEYCYNLTIAPNCYGINIRNGVRNSRIGSYGHSITLKEGVISCVIESTGEDITLGLGCDNIYVDAIGRNIQIGAYCKNITIPYVTRDVSFGQGCENITFSPNPTYEIIPHLQNCRFGDNIKNLNLSGATHVYQPYFCDIFLNTAGNAVLQYVDSLGILQTTDPTI